MSDTPIANMGMLADRILRTTGRDCPVCGPFKAKITTTSLDSFSEEAQARLQLGRRCCDCDVFELLGGWSEAVDHDERARAKGS